MGIQWLRYHHTQFVAEIIIIKVWHEKMIIHDELENSYLSKQASGHYKRGFVYNALLIAYRTLLLNWATARVKQSTRRNFEVGEFLMSGNTIHCDYHNACHNPNSNQSRHL